MSVVGSADVDVGASTQTVTIATLDLDDRADNRPEKIHEGADAAVP
jgi:hypothetical protein